METHLVDDWLSLLGRWFGVNLTRTIWRCGEGRALKERGANDNRSVAPVSDDVTWMTCDRTGLLCCF